MENNSIVSYWVAVSGPEYGCFEMMFHDKPRRAYSGAKVWYDEITIGKIQKLAKQWIGNNDYSMVLPYGTIEKLIGRKLTWKDEPVEIKIDLANYKPKQELSNEKSYLFEPDGTVTEIQLKNNDEIPLQECYDLIQCRSIETYNIGDMLLIYDKEGRLNHKEWNYPVMEYLKNQGFKDFPEFIGNCMVIKLNT